MKFGIETIFNSGSGLIGVSSHEPNGDFYTHNLNDSIIEDNVSVPNSNTFYPFDKPNEKTPPSITTLDVDEFGVKKSIGWGSGAYYHPTDSEYSYLVLPIYRNDKLSTPPTVEHSISGNVLSLNISDSGNCECVRIVAIQGNKRIDRVEYFKKGLINTSVKLEFVGNVNIWVQAYSNEINTVSEKVHFDIVI